MASATQKHGERRPATRRNTAAFKIAAASQTRSDRAWSGMATGMLARRASAVNGGGRER